MRNNLKNIKIIATDVDGVLTDSGMYYSPSGDFLKKFHTRDGMGVTILQKIKIPTIIITKEKTKMVKMWAKKMNIAHLYDGVLNKAEILNKISKKFDVSSSEICYLGDDINDLELLNKVGFSACPKDAVIQVRKSVDYICKSKGGEGVLREIADLIVSKQS
tara:strand:+ start:1655 stop:2137 length:483 start_codon:yes stop_codon:yes gene_type:complete